MKINVNDVSKITTAWCG